VSSALPGFDFHHRRGGGDPTVLLLLFKDSETLTQGDLLTVHNDGVTLAASGDRTLVGAATETVTGRAGVTYIPAITDPDAVYAVDDPYARAHGDLLVVTGASGAQGVGAADCELVVEADSTAAEATLVAIAVGCHRAPGAIVETRHRPTGSDLNAALARLVTRYYRENTGRGPTKTQAFYRGEVLVVVLEDTLTKAEQSLVARGRRDAVLHLRRAFQETMREELVATVEDLTGTRVRALMSANSIEPDITVETFILDAPVGG
jgi:uncharacterized protein YbcI